MKILITGSAGFIGLIFLNFYLKIQAQNNWYRQF